MFLLLIYSMIALLLRNNFFLYMQWDDFSQSVWL